MLLLAIKNLAKHVFKSFVYNFFLNKFVPSSIIISEDIKERKLIEKTLSNKEGKQISISTAKKGSKLRVINLAIKNAKNSLNRKLYESQNNRSLLDEIGKKFKIDNSISLVEVYDNSHIQGTNSVGALITYGDEGFIKKGIENLILKLKSLNKMIME